MTAAEAITGLAPIVGAGGVASVLVAYLGYKAQAAKGRADGASVPPAAISSAPFAAKDAELMVNAMTQLCAAVARLVLILEFQVVEAAEKHDDFREFAEKREMQAEIAALRRQQHRP